MVKKLLALPVGSKPEACGGENSPPPLRNPGAGEPACRRPLHPHCEILAAGDVSSKGSLHPHRGGWPPLDTDLAAEHLSHCEIQDPRDETRSGLSTPTAKAWSRQAGPRSGLSTPTAES